MTDPGLALAAERLARAAERGAAALERLVAVFEATDDADTSPAQPEVDVVVIADD